MSDLFLYRMLLHGMLYSELVWVRLILAAAEHLGAVSCDTTCVSNPPHMTNNTEFACSWPRHTALLTAVLYCIRTDISFACLSLNYH